MGTCCRTHQNSRDNRNGRDAEEEEEEEEEWCGTATAVEIKRRAATATTMGPSPTIQSTEEGMETPTVHNEDEGGGAAYDAVSILLLLEAAAESGELTGASHIFLFLVFFFLSKGGAKAIRFSLFFFVFCVWNCFCIGSESKSLFESKRPGLSFFNQPVTSKRRCFFFLTQGFFLCDCLPLVGSFLLIGAVIFLSPPKTCFHSFFFLFCVVYNSRLQFTKSAVSLPQNKGIFFLRGGNLL